MKHRIPSKAAAPSAAVPTAETAPVTLSIDVGGSGLKAMLLDPSGKPASKRERVKTPIVATPEAVLLRLDRLRTLLPEFDRVSVGFPGVVKQGATMGAANLHAEWRGFHLQSALEERWQRPVRVANDADIAGYGAMRGKGVELTLTLGTGLGSALFIDGQLCPNLELCQHPWRKQSYEEYLGRRGLNRYGKKKWNRLLLEAIRQTEATFNWQHLYLGGGNAKKIDFEPWPSVSIVSSETGLLGGVALWRNQEQADRSKG